jgi:uncharacterized protein YjbI with pentapeptide repeats
VLGDLVDLAVSGRDWANAVAPRIEFVRVELNDCRLTGAQLGEAALRDVTFTACRLDLAGLRMSRLERVVFRDCEMGECDLYQATLKDALFERCDLHKAVFTGAALTRAEFRRCVLAELQGVEALRGARMSWQYVVENGPVFAAGLGIEIID